MVVSFMKFKLTALERLFKGESLKKERLNRCGQTAMKDHLGQGQGMNVKVWKDPAFKLVLQVSLSTH